MHHHCHTPPTTHRTILLLALALNFPLFVLETWMGFAVDSSSLIADAMDFLSDSFSYLLTLAVLSLPLATRAKASIVKAVLMLLLAAFALWQGVSNLASGTIPGAFTMGWVAVLALIANLATAAILYKTRTEDSNMRSIWLCSRNDAINNILIMISAGLVVWLQSPWPDFAVALFIAGLEGSSAVSIIRDAKKELKA